MEGMEISDRNAITNSLNLRQDSSIDSVDTEITPNGLQDSSDFNFEQPVIDQLGLVDFSSMNVDTAMITCVSKFPALWDRTHLLYNNNKLNRLLWNDIAAVLKTDVQKARRKWSKIKSNYRREYEKTMKSGNPSRYQHYEALRFLEKGTQELYAEKMNHGLSNSTNEKMAESADENLGTPDNYDSDEDCLIIDETVCLSDESWDVPRVSSTIPAPLENEVNVNPIQTNLQPLPQPIQHTPNGEEGDNQTTSTTRAKIFIRPKKLSELMEVSTISSTSAVDVQNGETSTSSTPSTPFVTKEVSISKISPTIVKSETDVCDTSVACEEPPNKSSCVSNIIITGVSSVTTPIEFISSESGSVVNRTNNYNATILNPPYVPPPPSSTPTVPEPIVVVECKQEAKTAVVPAERPFDNQLNQGFLLGLLPDVETMSSSEFRAFKKLSTTLVSMILDGSK